MGLALNEVKGSFFPSQHSTGLYYFVLKNDLDPPPSLQPPSAVQRDAPQLQEQVPPQHLMLLITKLRLTPEQTPRPNPIITPQPPSLGRILTLLAIKLPPCMTTACHSSWVTPSPVCSFRPHVSSAVRVLLSHCWTCLLADHARPSNPQPRQGCNWCWLRTLHQDASTSRGLATSLKNVIVQKLLAPRMDLLLVRHISRVVGLYEEDIVAQKKASSLPRVAKSNETQGRRVVTEAIILMRAGKIGKTQNILLSKGTSDPSSEVFVGQPNSLHPTQKHSNPPPIAAQVQVERPFIDFEVFDDTILELQSSSARELDLLRNVHLTSKVFNHNRSSRRFLVQLTIFSNSSSWLRGCLPCISSDRLLHLSISLVSAPRFLIFSGDASWKLSLPPCVEIHVVSIVVTQL